ncbi:MAG: hypothetical protein K0B87_04920 [Candidatus Syntrophosphaera sp.]|nr:hypothetical protein [Candidatus Syntrophosphaera sp.]
MTSNKSLLVIALLLAAVAGLSAWSITDTYFGNRIGAQDARSYAMGGTGIFEDLRPFGIAANPANLTLLDKKLGLGGSLVINRNEDNRAVPLYNSFDNYIDDAVYASNINAYDNFAGAGFGSAWLGRVKLGMGAYYQPLLSFNGNYLEEIRNNRNTDNDGYPEKIAVNSIENEGLLNQVSGVLSLGTVFGDYLDVNLGLDYGYLRGELRNSKTIRWTDWATNTVGEGVLPDYTEIADLTLDGFRFKAGTSIRINRNFGIAATYTPKATLDRTGSATIQKDAYLNNDAIDTLTPISEEYILPMELRLGLNYQPRNIMRTWFNIEAEYVQFSDVHQRYDDLYNLYAGVEHHVVNRLPLRLGFQATSSYLRVVESDGEIIAKQVLTPMITGGSSIPLKDNLFLDLGFGYSWREYEALDMFGDSYYNDKVYTGNSSYQLWPNQYIVLADRGWENPDKVRENNISIRTTLSFTW